MRAQMFILLNILVASFLFVPVVHACDPTGCLMVGKEQDILAIVTVVSTERKVATVTADHFNKVSRMQPKEMFQIDFTNGTPWFPLLPEVGKHYFVSLACDDLLCKPKWGVWEVDSTDYQHAKLTEIRWGDDAAIEWFMNEKEGSLYGVSEKMFVKTETGDYEIYPIYRQVNPEDPSWVPRSWKYRSEVSAVVGIIVFVVLLLKFAKNTKR